MKYYYTYQTKNLINGKTYIGIHTTSKLEDGYMGSGINLRRAINKYGLENFTKTILSFFDTVEEMVEEEKFLVNEEWVKSKDNYNIALGGRGGNTYFNKSDEEMKIIKSKISKNHMGIRPSEETLIKLSIAKSGENAPMYKSKKSGLPLWITYNNRYKDRFYVLCIRKVIIGRFETLEEAIIEKNKHI